MVTAGLIAGLDATILSDAALGITSSSQNGLTLASFDPANPATLLRNFDNFGPELVRGAVHAVVRSGLTAAIQGGKFDRLLLDGLKQVAVNQVLAGVQGAIGDLTDGLGVNDLPVLNMIAHAIAGGLAAEATGGKFAAGAASALASAIAANAGLFSGLDPKQLSAVSQLIGATAALVARGSATDVNQGAAIAQSAAINNYLTHQNLKDLKAELLACKAKPSGCSKEEQRRLAEKWRRISLENDRLLAATCSDTACVAAAMAQKVGFFQGYREIAKLSPLVARFLHGTFAFDVLQPAWQQVQRNIRFRQDYEHYVRVKCGGIASAACAAAHLQAWERVEGKLALAEKAKLFLAMAMTGGAAAAPLVPRAIQAVRSCMATLYCLNQLGIGLAEAAAGDALAGSTLAFTVAAGGSRLVLRKGDTVVGLIDDTLGHLAAVNGASRGVPLFRTADGSVFRLTGAGDLALESASQTFRLSEVRRLFDKTSAVSGIRIGQRTVLHDGTRGVAKVLRGMSDAEIKRYFSELTGRALPSRPTTILSNGKVIYTVSTRYGNFNLRNFSSSGTGRWTIDIPPAVAGTTRKEIKFR